MSRTAWMRRLVSLLSISGLFLILGFIAVVLLVWFGGPLVALGGWVPLASVAARLFLLLMLSMGIIARYFWRARKQRLDTDNAVSQMMTGSDTDDLLKEEVNNQRDRMRQALALMKKWRPGYFRSVYELPWYMIIGAPGSGKSTALLNSGLEFPLKEEMGIDSIKGVGGTRYCDWWFTNRAVIIDTAGRYTTQESADKRDARGWNSFLGLLKKYRPRQPINGVILSISIADLLEQTPTERMLHARALKQRVQELKNRLGVVFPVYVVLTKFDLLEGFCDTFGMLTEQEREEVFGMTFTLDSVRDPKALPDAFDTEFDTLLERLSHFLLHRIQQERTPDSRHRIYQFPKQVALIRAPLWNLINEVFFPSAYEEVPILRGIYMVSSEQGAKTYDKISSLVDNQFRLKIPRSASANPSTAQDGFFLRHLFDNVVFAEHGLATSDGRKEKRFIWARRAVYGAMVTLTLGLGLAWYLSYQWNTALVAGYQAGIDNLKTDLALPAQDWLRLNALLSDAAALPGVLDNPMPDGGPRALGLFQGGKLGKAAEAAYGRLLEHQFGSALRDALEIEIKGNLTNLEYLYDTLKTYLMLNERSHLNQDQDQVHGWFEFILSRQLPGEINKGPRASLSRHLGRYLALGSPMAVESALVARARAELTAMPLAERAYQRIKLDAASSPLPDFRLPMVLGSVAELVFERRSGTSMKEGVPGFYTLNGYQGIFEPEKNQIVGRLLEDSWVYGEQATDFHSLDEAKIKAAVEDRYFRDYVYSWEQFLGDLRVKPFDSQVEGMRVANMLAGPEAPLGRLMAAVKRNTQLSAGEESTGDVLEEASGEALSRRSRERELNGIMRMLPDTADAETTLVDRAFNALNGLDVVIYENLQADAKLIARYFEEQSGNRAQALTTVSRSHFDGAVKGFYSTVNDSDSELLSQMLGGFVEDSRRLVKASVTRQINDIWQSAVYSDYQQAIAGNYPFDSKSQKDVALMDFANFFGYGGTLDQFFQKHLSSHVETSSSPWQLTSDVGISRTSLRLFEAAQRIREAFFEPGSRTPKISFSLKPLYLDSRVTQLMLEVDGQTLVYRHGPSRAISFSWPEQSGFRLTRVAFTPGNASDAPVQKAYQGAWSVFRMLHDAGAMTPSDRVQTVDIQLESYLASLELTMDSVKHPFNTEMLEQFRLPATL